MDLIKVEDLGEIDYKKAWDYQEEIHKQIVSQKLENNKLSQDKQHKTTDYLLFCEHPHVYTLGKSGEQQNLLIQENYLKSIGATFYKINRGGDITYHGPGQIVGYPIIDLEHFKFSVKKYIHILEASIINTLSHYNIKAERLDGSTGVWLDTDDPTKSRKICAIGVRISRYVSMHGYALNVSTDLDYFRHINPCGFIDKGVTSMEKELGEKVNIDNVKKILTKELDDLLDKSTFVEN